MPNLPATVQIDLPQLVTLLGHYWSAVNSQVGDLGTVSYDETVQRIASRSVCKITPEELESLVYHTKQAIFEKLKPVHTDRRQKSYFRLMKKLKDEIPQLFKALPSGEIVFINYEDRNHDGM